jgi:hypothetical protein
MSRNEYIFGDLGGSRHLERFSGPHQKLQRFRPEIVRRLWGVIGTIVRHRHNGLGLVVWSDFDWATKYGLCLRNMTGGSCRVYMGWSWVLSEESKRSCVLFGGRWNSPYRLARQFPMMRACRDRKIRCHPDPIRLPLWIKNAFKRRICCAISYEFSISAG